MEKTWNRWHTDGWVLSVVRSADGHFSYSVAQNDKTFVTGAPATNVADAQHKAEDIVRNSGHRCLGPCSYWVAEGGEDD